MFDDVVIIDDVGWGDLILGDVIGALKLSDHKYVERRIQTSFFQQPNFDQEKYLDEAMKIAGEIVRDLDVDEETVFKVSSGTILAKIKDYLKTNGFNVKRTEETGELGERVEKSYLEWCVEAGVPRKYLESGERFWRLLDWIDEKPETRGKFVKTAWGTWQLGFVNHETLMKVGRMLGGDEGDKIVEILGHAYEVEDLEIVAKTGLALNKVRKILYDLYDHAIVGLRRSRDKDTGWFVFNWRLQPEKIDGFLTVQKRHVLKKLEIRLDYEKNHEFYYCQTPECKRFTFEEATEHLFRCPKCDKPTMYCSNENIIESLTEKIEQLRGELI